MAYCHEKPRVSEGLRVACLNKNCGKETRRTNERFLLSFVSSESRNICGSLHAPRRPTLTHRQAKQKLESSLLTTSDILFFKINRFPPLLTFSIKSLSYTSNMLQVNYFVRFSPWHEKNKRRAFKLRGKGIVCWGHRRLCA